MKEKLIVAIKEIELTCSNFKGFQAKQFKILDPKRLILTLVIVDKCIHLDPGIRQKNMAGYRGLSVLNNLLGVTPCLSVKYA